MQPFSSRGPTDDGRIKPDLMAPDGVSTSSYGPLAFYGTSAAAPHVAGVAALLLSSDRSLTLDELRLTLESSATDKGAPGKDTIYGMGIIDAHIAFQRIHGGLQKYTISVHAYPDEYQYPEELSKELSAGISISYVYDGIASSMNALTPLQIQADIGSNATFTVESIPPGYAWNEWDNYGYGRTSSETLKITLNEDHAVIAYFTKINITNNTLLEVHAHSIDFQYPDEPNEELPLTLKVTYIYNRTIHDAESIKIGSTSKKLMVDPNSTAILTVATTPIGFTWNKWQIVDGESTSNQTIHISVEGNTTSIVVAYLESSTVEVGFTVTAEPEFIIYVPGQTVDFNIYLAPINEFDGEVILKVEAPPEVEVQLTPERLHPPGSAKLTVTVNEETRDRMEITVKAIFENTTTFVMVTLQAWSIPGFSASAILVGSILALTILYFERKRSNAYLGIGM